MTDILDLLGSVLGGGTLNQLGEQLGLDADQTQAGVAVAVPALLEALTRNASDPSGSDSLYEAVSNDHDGSVLDDLVGLLGGGYSQDGQGILGHLFGDRTESVAQQLGSTSGVGSGGMLKLLATLAPLLMGILGKLRGSRQLDSGGLGDLIKGTNSKLQDEQPGLSDILGGILGGGGQGGTGGIDLGSLGGLLGKILGQ